MAKTKAAPEAATATPEVAPALTFPRYMYRADGTAEVFSSAEAFAEFDDGKWAPNPADVGIVTAPSIEQIDAQRKAAIVKGAA